MQKSKNQQRPIRVGVFRDVAQADKAVERLLEAGFGKDQISVVCSDKAVEAHFRAFEHQEPAGTFTPQAAIAGGTIGAVLGGLTTAAIGVATGGIGLLATAGIGLGAGGAAGSFVGAMMTRGVEKELANFYDQAVVDGQILVAAEADGSNVPASLNKAERILADAGATPVPLPEG